MKKKFNNIGILIQLILGTSAVIIGIISIFVNEFIIPLELVLVITMGIMAYNNEKVFKRKYMSIVYLLLGLVILISIIKEII